MMEALKKVGLITSYPQGWKSLAVNLETFS